ncbi:hypothetical protein [Leptolyngbya sp. FACHB-261]|uniref:hypothetical protein n=1 Tax=Leptolyngbya sp. FACHB-261 TaxID=2692806 RepID=UPI001685D69B|nr:hypothetical protein [Leptolyngbya sp. FACHB-261]MBD2100774.1 hypothetical protein [Leptolyngbya sp. FACHB-261]
MPEKPSETSIAMLWAKRYIRFLGEPTFTEVDQRVRIGSSQDLLHLRTAQKVKDSLSLVLTQALSLTHQFLDEVIQQQRLDPRYLDPLQILVDNRKLFEMVLDVFREGHGPDRLSVQGSWEFGRVRQRYTQQDGRVLGFVGMHVHYASLGLLEKLTLSEQACFEPYLQVMIDHLYIPLRACYEAAAEHEEDSLALQAVQALLPRSSEIANLVFEQACLQVPGYHSYSGELISPAVRQSTIRDIEMFQAYLCLCLLEDNIRSVQRELFPLCVLLYPRLKVSWEMVRLMIREIEISMQRLIPRELVGPFMPYLRDMKDMFSPEVFQELVFISSYGRNSSF